MQIFTALAGHVMLSTPLRAFIFLQYIIAVSMENKLSIPVPFIGNLEMFHFGGTLKYSELTWGHYLREIPQQCCMRYSLENHCCSCGIKLWKSSGIGLHVVYHLWFGACLPLWQITYQLITFIECLITWIVQGRRIVFWGLLLYKLPLLLKFLQNLLKNKF